MICLVMQNYDMSVTVLSQLFRYLEARNINVENMIKSLNLDPTVRTDPDKRIPVETYLKIEDAAIKISNDPFLGLHCGEYMEPNNWSVLGYLMKNCQTLGQAFVKSKRYTKIIGNIIQFREVFGIGKFTMILSTPKSAPVLPRHCFETALTSVVVMIKNLTGKDIKPLETGFSYSAPESISEYKRIFGPNVKFNQKRIYMVYSFSIVKLPVLVPDPQLLKYFEKYADEYLSRLENSTSTEAAVSKHLLTCLDKGKVSLPFIANKMAVSVRTLQNRLKDEGIIFRDLLKKTRINLAEKYLMENYPVEDITYLLGFKESSTFRKAFKEWSGKTPQEFRIRSRMN